MKIDKLKTLLIAVCCFVITLCSGSQGMDNLTDIEGESSHGATITQLSTQDEMEALDFEATPSQSVSLEDSQTSLVSYLASSVKVTMEVANEFMSIASHNPKLAMVVGMCYILPAVSAGCECMCREWGYHPLNCTGTAYYIGCSKNISTCAWLCRTAPEYCGILNCIKSCLPPL